MLLRECLIACVLDEQGQLTKYRTSQTYCSRCARPDVLLDDAPPLLIALFLLFLAIVILTRLQRVTFLTAHKYLGLTREVIRTEKAINELACHPLPEIFWESGGIQRLRQRFLPQTKTVNEEIDRSTIDYFALNPPTPYGPPMSNVRVKTMEDDPFSEAVKLKFTPLPSKNATHRAGDLHTMSSVSPSIPSVNFDFGSPSKDRRRSSGVADLDFDLREAVMASISKAIGLVQPSCTPTESVEASPMVRPQDQNLQKAVFNSSFGSLSFLGLQGYDDESSVTGSSTAGFAMSELDNEVEILYFPKDSMLVKAGEKNAGLYFVIEGFLDVSMPKDALDGTATKNSATTSAKAAQPLSSMPAAQSRRTASISTAPLRTPSRQQAHPPLRSSHRSDLPPLSMPTHNSTSTAPATSTPLFTIKPGGIAGYLSSLSGFPSYVDIQAKTECYVGFLPAKALERIMDRKPIVLLTLAKRLISLLSPLGSSPLL